MTTPIWRSVRICIGLALMPLCNVAACAQLAETSADMRMLPYAKPGQRVDIGGRQINLHCSGQGDRTVVLLAGLGSWSPVWYLTQPEIAKRARVCAFDRASYGFSDPTPRPQLLSDIPDDLHAALKAANLPAPYVLVGHSLGGLEARIFAERWPQEVAGMVLVDTSPAAESVNELGRPGYDDSQQPERYASKMLGCALMAARGVDLASPDYTPCVQALPSEAPAALLEVWPDFYDADYMATQLSLMASTFTHRYDSADHIDLGEMPLIVLSANTGEDIIGPAGAFWRSYRTEWFARHEALSQLSSHGVHRVIEGAGHLIQLDKPQAVIDAVSDVLDQLGEN